MTNDIYSHQDIWTAIDRLAKSTGFSASGLAKQAGLDPTTFNKSKRESADGKPRWPSTESLAKILAVTNLTMHDFVNFMDDGNGSSMTHLDQSTIAAEAAKILIETESVLFNAKEPFTFTSGAQSPVYVDCRRLISFPKARKTLMDFAAHLLKNLDIDYVAGGETAGIPYAAFVAERLDKPMLYVRKKPKGFGRMAQIEGHMDGNAPKVLLVEDLQSQGTSKKVFIDALREAGARVDHTFVVFHYNIYESSKQSLKDLKVDLTSLTDWWHVLDAARESGTFDDMTLDTVEAFLNAPDDWAA